MKVSEYISKASFSILMAWSSMAAANDIYFDNSCCSSSNYTFDASASYLYWGVQDDPLAFAIENVTLQQASIATGTGKIKTHKPKWNSGIRVEGGIVSSCIPLGCRVQWTNLQTNSKAAAFSNIPGILSVAATTVSSNPNSMGTPFFSADSAHSIWHFNINEYAFDIEYMGCRGSCFTFQPYVGVFGATIKHKQNVLYSGAAVASIITDIAVERKNHFCGVGPRIGVGMNWNVFQQISLISDANIAYLYGEFETKNHVTSGAAVASRFLDLDEKVHRGRPMTSGLIGLEWKDQISCNYGISLSVSYEFQYWWQQWHSSSSLLLDLLSGEGQRGDLALHGLVVTGGISF